MSFSETIFLFFLALIIFGPKKLPEIAKQAGRLLAELRRASNEFRSQIETEIAHLEVEKKQTILPPGGPPPGTLASLSLNPASTEVASETRGTLAVPAGPTSAVSNSADLPSAIATAVPENPDTSPVTPSPTVREAEIVSAPQDSHV
ncbi:MAG: twin-arginine translocase TatA/TatE family subunit [Candidatus Sulfotelmatobacter sp.]